MKYKKRYLILIIISLIILPILGVLITIGLNSDYLIKRYILLILIALFIFFANYLIFIFIKKRKQNNRKLKKKIKIILSIVYALYVLGAMSFVFILYGPYDGFRTWLITTAMQTKDHQY